MKPRVVQCKHARKGKVFRNWKVQHNGWEYVYRSWFRAMKAARMLATYDTVPTTGLRGINRIQ